MTHTVFILYPNKKAVLFLHLLLPLQAQNNLSILNTKHTKTSKLSHKTSKWIRLFHLMKKLFMMFSFVIYAKPAIHLPTGIRRWALCCSSEKEHRNLKPSWVVCWHKFDSIFIRTQITRAAERKSYFESQTCLKLPQWCVFQSFGRAAGMALRVHWWSAGLALSQRTAGPRQSVRGIQSAGKTKEGIITACERWGLDNKRRWNVSVKQGGRLPIKTQGRNSVLLTSTVLFHVTSITHCTVKTEPSGSFS